MLLSLNSGILVIRNMGMTRLDLYFFQSFINSLWKRFSKVLETSFLDHSDTTASNSCCRFVC